MDGLGSVHVEGNDVDLRSRETLGIVKGLRRFEVGEGGVERMRVQFVTCTSLHSREPLAHFCCTASTEGCGPALHSGPWAEARARTRARVAKAAR